MEMTDYETDTHSTCSLACLSFSDELSKRTIYMRQWQIEYSVWRLSLESSLANTSNKLSRADSLKNAWNRFKIKEENLKARKKSTHGIPTHVTKKKNQEKNYFKKTNNKIVCVFEKQQKRQVQAVIFNAANAYNLLVEQGIDETVKNPT